MPNSSARLILGAGPPPSRVCGRIRLFLGGGGREVSRMLIDGPRTRSLPPLGLGMEASSALRLVDELRNRSCGGLGPGAEGVRAGASSIMLGLGFGNVSERLLSIPRGCGVGGSRSSPPLLSLCSCGGGPKPPYPFLRGTLGGGMPPPPPLDDAVPGRRALSKGDSGRASPAPLPLLLRGNAFAPLVAEGRRLISKGPGAILFIRVRRLCWPFCWGLVPKCDGSATSKSPSRSPRPPYPPGLRLCAGGGESAIAGAKKSSPSGPDPALFGVFGDIACEPVEALIGVIWSVLEFD